MTKLRKVILIVLLIGVILVGISTKSYAEVEVTEEKIKASLEEILEAYSESNNYEVTVADNVISLKSGGSTYSFKYDLTDKPTFTYEIPITKGMTYAEFESKNKKIILPIAGYLAVANIEGAKVDSLFSYMLIPYLTGNFTNLENSTYTIVDDISTSVEKTEDPNKIYASEFGDKVMDYVNSIYNNTMVTDSEDLNSYTFKVEKKDVEAESCTIVSTVSVNVDADFASLNAGEEEVPPQGGGQEGTPDPAPAQEGAKETGEVPEVKAEAPIVKVEDGSIAKEPLPKTGTTSILLILSIISILSAIILKVKVKNYKDIK